MKNYKSFFAGMLTMLLIVCLTGTALATTGKVTKELEYRNISVSLDGKKLDLRDAKGNAVEPFMFEGTNYLPVRALAESLGLNVAWDGKTATVVLTTPGAEPVKPATPAGKPTVGQANALEKAKSYLSISAFSYKGLIEQLEYVKFSHEEAVYAADHCGADWMEQAVKKAASYLQVSSFSRDGLIEQLEYVGFTHDQAVYGAEQNGF